MPPARPTNLVPMTIRSFRGKNWFSKKILVLLRTRTPKCNAMTHLMRRWIIHCRGSPDLKCVDIT